MSADPIEETFPLTSLLDTVLSPDARGWRVERSGRWCHVRRPDQPARRQGWKLHLSATPLSAPLVLVAAARVLVEARCQFKFAADLAAVKELTDGRADRGGGGKFLTVYPADDERFRRLAERLDLATAGLPGPAILSDRRYRPGSLVYYRFGAFTGVTVLTNDGTYDCRLTAADGTLVPDQRRAWFSPPAWADNPFPSEQPAPNPPTRPAAVLLNDRFEVRRAIQHANKGGVYRARDRRTGAEVVVKQARPHTQASVAGTDGRDLLRHEARMLHRLAPLGRTPRLVDLFEQSGDLFLAEEQITGTPLRTWAARQAAERADGVPVAQAWALAARLVELVAAVHDAGLVLRDLSPNNLLVVPGPDVRLVDVEFAAEPGTPGPRVHTPGYGAPEVLAAPRFGPCPGPETDRYALGATLFHLATGVDPVFPDGPGPVPAGRIARLAATIGAHLPALAALAPLIAGLTGADPASRWDLGRARELLLGPPPPAAPSPAVPRSAGFGPGSVVDVAIADGLDHLRRLVDTGDPGRATRTGGFGAAADPCAVQHGAAGVLMTLVRGAQVRPEPVARAAVRDLADWLAAAVDRAAPALPGLYFGRSGTSVALGAAADLLGDEALAEHAAALARRVPVRWPNPDVCHGAAGAGLANLLWWRRTGDDDFLDRVRDCADGLLAAAVRDGRGVWWPVPDDFDSVLAGSCQLGFGHGVAGVGAFLLQAAQATGHEDYLRVAVEAGGTLRDTAIVEDQTAWWPRDRADSEPAYGPMTPHWCSGASGIGTFLVRLGSATGDGRLVELAGQAARTAWRARWSAPPVQCHGTAGDGELLLDLAELTGVDGHRRQAEELAVAILSRAVRRDGLLVVADETLRDVVADHQTGLAGTLAFLIRLRHGGARGWLADPPTDSAAGVPMPAVLAGSASGPG
ncbi:class IV lanthionine synthetase LanL [Solwaraspora sp. WMMD1047]|uniref:class IV lanthionine synthetase LanL n=1 Tax=Solwaraspora sp. WMMD1047 TaxID=3016102 RepID=UPI0024177665|nr:class IV lanthionine synthetase LanL [Solwaraspora sp. WMMD1047]MDG4832105.1 class IV lanthionine synthetase LanL [Solwaraspora sp. WMMD1047]